MNKEEFAKLEKEIQILNSTRNAILDELGETVGCQVCGIQGFNGDSPKIHIEEGIQQLANKLHEPLYMKGRGKYSRNYPYEYYFMHEGIRYFQIEKRIIDVKVGVKEE